MSLVIGPFSTPSWKRRDLAEAGATTNIYLSTHTINGWFGAGGNGFGSNQPDTNFSVTPMPNAENPDAMWGHNAFHFFETDPNYGYIFRWVTRMSTEELAGEVWATVASSSATFHVNGNHIGITGVEQHEISQYCSTYNLFVLELYDLALAGITPDGSWAQQYGWLRIEAANGERGFGLTNKVDDNETMFGLHQQFKGRVDGDVYGYDTNRYGDLYGGAWLAADGEHVYSVPFYPDTPYDFDGQEHPGVTKYKMGNFPLVPEYDGTMTQADGRARNMTIVDPEYAPMSTTNSYGYDYLPPAHMAFDAENEGFYFSTQDASTFRVFHTSPNHVSPVQVWSIANSPDQSPRYGTAWVYSKLDGNIYFFVPGNNGLGTVGAYGTGGFYRFSVDGDNPAGGPQLIQAFIARTCAKDAIIVDRDGLVWFGEARGINTNPGGLYPTSTMNVYDPATQTLYQRSARGRHVGFDNAPMTLPPDGESGVLWWVGHPDNDDDDYGWRLYQFEDGEIVHKGRSSNWGTVLGDGTSNRVPEGTIGLVSPANDYWVPSEAALVDPTGFGAEFGWGNGIFGNWLGGSNGAASSLMWDEGDFWAHIDSDYYNEPPGTNYGYYNENEYGVWLWNYAPMWLVGGAAMGRTWS